MKEKACTKCGVTKSLDSKYFTKNPRYKEGFSTWCKECHKTAGNVWKRKEAIKNPDYHKDCALRKHHMSIEQYNTLLREQGEHCALCDATSSEGQRLSVDHNHEICAEKYACDKCRRGLLCSACNAALGYLELFLADAWVFPMLGKGNSWTGRALKYLDSYKGIALN